MEHLQVLIVSEKDPNIFERTLNTKLRNTRNIKTLTINDGPPGRFYAIITYMKSDGKEV